MRLLHRHLQTVDHKLTVMGEVETVKDDSSYEIERPHQVAPAAVEATLGWIIYKEIPMLLPLA
jgi:hypothetical protein